MRFLLLSGSFHQRSYSQALLKVVEQQLGAAHEGISYPIDQLPFFNPDLCVDGDPDEVATFLQLLKDCDAVIVCSPEYNHSIPAVLKNALDWASRPAFNSVLKDKPVTVFTQASSPVGGARAQAHLRLVFDSTLSKLFPGHQQVIGEIHQKFDGDLCLTDETLQLRIQRHLESFLAWTRQQNLSQQHG